MTRALVPAAVALTTVLSGLSLSGLLPAASHAPARHAATAAAPAVVPALAPGAAPTVAPPPSG